MRLKFQTHRVPVAILVLAGLVFFWPVVLGALARTGERWHIPQGGGDLTSFLWPVYRYNARSIRAGSLPIWNPFLYSGAPHLADNQSGVLYPPNVLLALLPDVPYEAVEWLVVAHVVFAGIGMYVLVRSEIWRTRATSAPALVAHSASLSGVGAGLAFMFSSLFVTHVGNLNIVATAAWLPWTTFALRRMFGSGRAVWAGAAGLTGGLAVLAGHAQMSFALLVVAGIVCLWSIRSVRAWRLLGLIALAAVVAFGVAAAAVIPAVELLGHTARADFSYEAASQYSLPPLGLAGVLSPILFGRGARAFWPAWERVELGFVGLTTLLLAAVALRRRARRWMWIVIAIVGLLIALGEFTPVHRVLTETVPGFGALRVPARFILLANFALAVLAGFGLSDLTARRANSRLLLVLAMGLAAVALFALPAGWRSAAASLNTDIPPTLFLALALAIGTIAVAGVILRLGKWQWFVGLIAVEMIGLGSWVEVERSDPDAGYTPGPAVGYLSEMEAPFRIDVAATAWQPDAPLVFGLESVGGVFNPLGLARYDAYYWSVGSRGSEPYNFLNAQYLVADKGVPAADDSFVPVYDSDPKVDVYLNTNAQPRVRAVFSAVPVDSVEQAFAAIHDPSFDFRSSVVVEGGVELPPSEGASVSSLFYLAYEEQRHAVVVESSAPAYVVFAEVWYPGWRAFVDDQPAEVVRANYAFRAVYVPAGEHVVRVEFYSVPAIVGLAISVFTVVGLGMWYGITVYRRGATR